MEIFRFNIDPEAVTKGMQEGDPFIRVSNACPCGCAPYPFVSLSDGKVGVTAQFDTEAELDKFKQAINQLNRG